MDMILFGPGVYITIATYEMNATKSNMESPPWNLVSISEKAWITKKQDRRG